MTKEEAKKLCKEYAERRDRALNGDLETFKAWLYEEPLMDKSRIPQNEEVLEIAMHKMRIECEGVYPKKKEESKKWLEAHDCYVGGKIMTEKEFIAAAEIAQEIHWLIMCDNADIRLDKTNFKVPDRILINERFNEICNDKNADFLLQKDTSLPPFLPRLWKAENVIKVE